MDPWIYKKPSMPLFRRSLQPPFCKLGLHVHVKSLRGETKIPTRRIPLDELRRKQPVIVGRCIFSSLRRNDHQNLGAWGKRVAFANNHETHAYGTYSHVTTYYQTDTMADKTYKLNTGAEIPALCFGTNKLPFFHDFSPSSPHYFFSCHLILSFSPDI